MLLMHEYRPETKRDDNVLRDSITRSCRKMSCRVFVLRERMHCIGGSVRSASQAALMLLLFCKTFVLQDRVLLSRGTSEGAINNKWGHFVFCGQNYFTLLQNIQFSLNCY